MGTIIWRIFHFRQWRARRAYYALILVRIAEHDMLDREHRSL